MPLMYLLFLLRKKFLLLWEISIQLMYFHFTKNKDYTICVAKEFLKPTDRVLSVDDFLAMGNAVLGLKSLVESAGAEVIGAGIAVEKGFQQGEKTINR